MTDMVTMLLIIGAGYYAWQNGMLDELVEQLKAVNLGGGGGGGETAPAPVPEAAPVEGGEEAAPAEGGGGAEPAAAGGCDCSCMPMDSDPSKFKIETAGGEDCYGNVYPASMAECETALKEVCAKRGGGGATEPAAAEGGGEDDKAAEGGGEDSGGESGGGDDKESNYARSCMDYTPMNWG